MKLLLSAATVSLAALSPLTQAQVYSNATSTVLPDLTTSSSTITVAGGPASIADLNVIIDIDQRTVTQLDIVLVPPGGGSYIRLVSALPVHGEDFTKTRFDQQSPVLITSGAPLALAPFTASYQPEGGPVTWRPGATIPLPGPALSDLAALNGTNANGTWTLLIDDHAASNSGRLKYWSLEFNNAVDPKGPPFGKAPVITAGTCTPNPVTEGQAAVFTLTVEPGTAPTSPLWMVWGDTSFAGGPGRTDFFDNGLNGDAVAGDGVYSATIALGAYPGAHAMGAHVYDTLGRNTCFALPFTIAATPSGACCIDHDCVPLREYECAVAGGVFTPGVECFPGSYAISSSAMPFTSLAGVGTVVPQSDQDDKVSTIDIGFPFNFYGRQYTSVGVSTNGNIQFAPSNSNSWLNLTFPNTRTPNNMIAPLWDDFDFNPVSGSGQLLSYFDDSGGVGNRTLTISWEGVEHYPNYNDSNSFQVVLFEDSSFDFRYGAITPVGSIASPSIGFENSAGTLGQNVSPTLIGSGNTALHIAFTPTPGPCLPECPPCAADFDGNGGVDGADLAAFFMAYEAGSSCGDVDQNGGVDGADLAYFFTVYEAGGC